MAVQTTISVVDSKALLSLFGTRDQHLRRIQDALKVNVSARDHQIQIEGEKDAVARATSVFEQLKTLADRRGSVASEDLSRVLAAASNGDEESNAPAIEIEAAGRVIRPLTSGQARYLEAIDQHDLVFGEGPAGTGKTYLAVATAVAALKREAYQKIVLCRPAVEAGESLGYLPGDLQAKINPYLRPLLDALREMMEYDQIKSYMERDVIEVIPLAYMRGRTLNEAFIILDEAQNTTVAQMKMFLTRFGRSSKVLVSGDTTQIDLPAHTRSGLVDAIRRLHGIKGFAHVKLTNRDIVRHPLVQEILRAYEESAKKRR